MIGRYGRSEDDLVYGYRRLGGSQERDARAQRYGTRPSVYRQVLTPHRERIERELAAIGGRVVSTAGDGHFLVFSDTISAARWAIGHRSVRIATSRFVRRKGTRFRCGSACTWASRSSIRAIPITSSASRSITRPGSATTRRAGRSWFRGALLRAGRCGHGRCLVSQPRAVGIEGDRARRNLRIGLRSRGTAADAAAAAREVFRGSGPCCRRRWG